MSKTTKIGKSQTNSYVLAQSSGLNTCTTIHKEWEQQHLTWHIRAVVTCFCLMLASQFKAFGSQQVANRRDTFHLLTPHQYPMMKAMKSVREVTVMEVPPAVESI